MRFHDVEIETKATKRSAIVKLDGKEVRGLLDFGIDFSSPDRPRVTLKIWPEKFCLVAQGAALQVECFDLRSKQIVDKGEVDGRIERSRHVRELEHARILLGIDEDGSLTDAIDRLLTENDQLRSEKSKDSSV